MSCPYAEMIVRDVVGEAIYKDPTLAASLIRLHFHDCFVRGCDASLMLDSHNGTAEKHADPNLTVRGYEVIEALKLKVEAECPLVVSCADLMTIAARDAVKFSDGPDYPVETGRRDGNISMAADAKRDLPPADGNVTVLTKYFAAKNLTMKDLVVLSGAHTLGVAHCPSFSGRVHNHTGAGDADPALDAGYLAKLNATCGPANVASVVPLDAATTDKFDLGYYQSVRGRKGLLGSDDALNHDSLMGAYVELMNNASSLDTFFQDFAVSMVKMGRVGVLTGEEGVIRESCTIFVD